MNISRLWPALRLCLGVFLGALSFVAHAEPQDIIFVFDNSGSMRKADPGFAARSASREFLASLAGDERRIGVLVFDDKVKQVAALDHPEALAKALDEVDYRGRLTDSPAAVERAMYELKQNGRADAAKIIVFMTDGIVDTGNAEKDAVRSRWLREDLTREAAAMNVRIFGMAFTESADIQLMQALSSATGATFERAYTPPELPAAFAKLKAAIDSPALPIAAPAASPTAAPAAVADPAAALSPESRKVLAGMSPDERAAMEQMARETGTTLDQLLKEFAAGQKIAPSEIKGEVVTAAPAAAQAPAPAPAQKSMLPMILGVVVVAGAAGAFVFLRKRGGGAAKAKPAGGSAAAAPARAAAVTQVPEAWLIDIDGHAGLPPHRLTDKPLMVGRIAGTDTDFTDHYVVDKATIGRRHAVIRHRDGGFWLIEQGSVNGTFINGVKVAGEQQLRNGDRIRFHKFEFEFQLPGGSSSEGTVVGAKLDQTLIASVNETLVASSAAALTGSSAGAPPPAAKPPVPPAPPAPAPEMTTVVQKLPLRPLAEAKPAPAAPEPAPALRPIDDKTPPLRPIDSPPSGLRPLDEPPPALRPLDTPAPGLRPLEDKAPGLRPLEDKPALRPLDAAPVVAAAAVAAAAPEAEGSGLFDEDDMTGMVALAGAPATNVPAPDFELLEETVQRPMQVPEPTVIGSAMDATSISEVDPLGETFIRPDDEALPDLPTPEPEVDASGFFNDFTMNAPSAAAIEGHLDDADLVPLDVTVPPVRAERRDDETAPSRDFYTATTVIPASNPPGFMMEDTAAFAATPVQEAAPEGLDDFFEIDPPVAPTAPPPTAAPVRAAIDTSDLDDFDMDIPVADSPSVPDIDFDFPEDDESAGGDAPLREDTVVLPSSPLTRGRGQSDT